MAHRGHHRTEGLTVVEAATGLAVLGIVLAVFVPTFVQELRTSKTAEAADELERLHRATAAYYGASHGPPSTVLRQCLPSAAGPTPRATSMDPRQTSFADDEDHGAIWQALGYEPTRPIRYRYTLEPTTEGCGARRSHLVTFRAEGDLDGDGHYSRFERMAGTDSHGAFVPIEILHVADRTE